MYLFFFFRYNMWVMASVYVLQMEMKPLIQSIFKSRIWLTNLLYFVTRLEPYAGCILVSMPERIKDEVGSCFDSVYKLLKKKTWILESMSANMDFKNKQY